MNNSEETRKKGNFPNLNPTTTKIL